MMNPVDRVRHLKVTVLAATVLTTALCGCPLTPGGGSYREPRRGNAHIWGMTPTARAIAFARIVDNPSLSADAGAIEPEAYGYLLENVRGEREEALRKRVDEEATYEGLMKRPEAFRGKIMTVYGMVLELRRTGSPTGWRPGGHQVYEGLIGTLDGEIYAIRILSRRGAGLPELGRMVWCSGYFLKRYAFRGSDGQIHMAPLLVCPAPTITDKKFRLWIIAKELGVQKYLPPASASRRNVDNRLLIEVDRDGVLGIDGLEVDAIALHSRLKKEASRAYRSPGVRDWGVVIWVEKGASIELVEEIQKSIRATRVLTPVLKVKVFPGTEAEEDGPEDD